MMIIIINDIFCKKYYHSQVRWPWRTPIRMVDIIIYFPKCIITCASASAQSAYSGNSRSSAISSSSGNSKGNDNSNGNGNSSNSANSKAEPIDEPRSEWSCLKCTFQNSGARKQCEMCGTNAPSEPAASRKWSCAVCTFENATGRTPYNLLHLNYRWYTLCLSGSKNCAMCGNEAPPLLHLAI